MLFRLILLALGIYAFRHWMTGAAGGARPMTNASGQIRNPMFYREGEEQEIEEAARPGSQRG